MTGEVTRARRFAWTSLFVWVLFGLALEAAHGFKVSAYMDDRLPRTMLRLAHAHGVILSLLVLAYGDRGASLVGSPARARRVGRWLRAGAILVPLGFALSAIRASESDPSLPIVLVPLGALALLGALGQIAFGAWRQDSSSSKSASSDGDSSPMVLIHPDAPKSGDASDQQKDQKT